MLVTDQQVKLICDQVEKLSELVEECLGCTMPKYRQRIYSLTITSLMKSPTEPNTFLDNIFDSITTLKSDLLAMVVQNPNTSLFDFIVSQQFNTMYNTFTKSQHQIKKIEVQSPRINNQPQIKDKVIKIRSTSIDDISTYSQDLEFFMLQKYMYDLIGTEACQIMPSKQKRRGQISFDSSFNMPLSRHQGNNLEETNNFDNKLNFTLQESQHIMEPENINQCQQANIVQSRITIQSDSQNFDRSNQLSHSNLFSIQYQERDRPTSRFDSDDQDIMTVNKSDLAQSREIIIRGINRGPVGIQNIPPFNVNIDNNRTPQQSSIKQQTQKRNILDLSKLNSQSKPSLRLDPKNMSINSSKIQFNYDNINSNTNSRYVASKNRPEMRQENRIFKAYSEHQNSTIRFQQMPHNQSIDTQSLRFEDLSKSVLQDKEQFLTQHQLMQQNSFLKSQNRAKEREILEMTRQIDHLVDENNNSQNLSLEMCHKTLKRKSETPSNLGSIKGNLHDLLRSMQRK